MADWLGSVKDIVSFAAADSKVILGLGASTVALGSIVSVAGYLPRVGLGRALSLGFKGYFKTTCPLSVRKSDVKKLSDSLLSMGKDDYIAVTGGKGIGKTCLINTTLNRHLGVVHISTESGASKSVVVDQALRALTGLRLLTVSADGSARRLLFFYSIMFKRSPIVVIRVPERLSGQKYADVPAAARELADEYGLRVVVDGSPNSIPPELLATEREIVFAVEPMSKELMESVPEFKDLIDFLKSHNLDEPVWKVLGGSPIHYKKLNALVVNMLSLRNTATDEIVNQVKDHLQSVLLKAFTKTVLSSSANTKHIINIFREKQTTKIPKAELEAMGFPLDYPNKVFRDVFVAKEDLYIVPSSPAVSLIISENVQSAAGVRELRDKLFKPA